MVQVASLFNQLLQHFPRTEFGALIKKNNAERGAKGFGCWTRNRGRSRGQGTKSGRNRGGDKMGDSNQLPSFRAIPKRCRQTG